jgi:hypothetical protein
MTEARLVVEPGTLKPGHKGPVTGGVWLSVGGRDFPASKWNDFVVVVLGWWAKAMHELVQGRVNHVEVHFMDGPYLVELNNRSPSEWDLRLVETGGLNKLRAQTSIAPGPLVESVMAASEAVLRECRKMSLWSVDTDALAEHLSALRQMSN